MRTDFNIDAKYDNSIAHFDEEIIITYKDTFKVFFTQMLFFTRREAYLFLANMGYDPNEFSIWKLPFKSFVITKNGYLKQRY